MASCVWPDRASAKLETSAPAGTPRTGILRSRCRRLAMSSPPTAVCAVRRSSSCTDSALTVFSGGAGSSIALVDSAAFGAEALVTVALGARCQRIHVMALAPAHHISRITESAIHGATASACAERRYDRLVIQK